MTRDSGGRFAHGNAAAKAKRGYKDRGRQLARLFTEADIQLVYRTLMQKAAEGDSAALSLISRYVAVSPKPAYSPTPFDYNQDDPLSGAQSVMVAVAKGDLPADVGRSLIEGLASVQRIREVVAYSVDSDQRFRSYPITLMTFLITLSIFKASDRIAPVFA